MIIYRAINKINNKSYIGQTTQSLEKRKHRHLDSSNYNKFIFHKALKKYGLENFDWEILMHCTSKPMLNAAEIFFIDRYNTKVPNGYNLTDGGEGLINPSEETIKKIKQERC